MAIASPTLLKAVSEEFNKDLMESEMGTSYETELKLICVICGRAGEI
ncbi:MAG: hypothetical protein ACRCWB_09615 [Enterovibrio sp.]